MSKLWISPSLKGKDREIGKIESSNGFRLPTAGDMRLPDESDCVVDTELSDKSDMRLSDNDDNISMPTTIEEKKAYLVKLVEDGKKCDVDDEYGVCMESGVAIFTFSEIFKMVEDAKQENRFYVFSKADMLNTEAELVDVEYKCYLRDKDRYLDRKRSGF